MQDQPRKFGVLYPSNFDIDYFKAQLKKYGVTLGVGGVVHRAPGDISLQTSSPEIDQQIPPLITKLKAAGVNNLIMMATHSVATHGDERDEDAGVVPRDHRRPRSPTPTSTSSSRPYDPDVWSHAFGLIWFLPGVAGGIPTPSVATFQWFWGTDKGTRWDGSNALLGALYTAIQFAGPKLTKQTVDAVAGQAAQGERGRGRRVQQQRVHVRGAATGSRGRHRHPRHGAGLVEPERGGDRATTTSSLNGKGEYMYLDDGKRYVAGTFPKAKKKFFDTKNSTSIVPRAPGLGTEVAHVPVPELPEHRQHLDHARRGAGLTRRLPARVRVERSAVVLHPAVHEQRLPGDERGVGSREERGDTTDVGGLAEPPDRDARE